MKRWIVNTAICGYLGALTFGFLCVACQVRFYFPPFYFLMYDMYGGWSGYDAQIEQQSCCTDIQGSAGAVGNSSDQVDLDSVNAAWLASLPHRA